jgi:hypothetical protein
MSNRDREHILRLIEKTADSMERTSACLREIGVELRALRSDLEAITRRVRKLEGERK